MEFTSLKEKYLYYRKQTDFCLSTDGYVMVMLDGRSFSKKIKKYFKRPFDSDFIVIMNETAKYLCEKVSGCKLAYVQSDEISLVLHTSEAQEPFFGNRQCKLLSIIASMATSKFNQLIAIRSIRNRFYDSTKIDEGDTLYCIKDVLDYMAVMPLYEFDCKVWNVPDINDAYASILYRQNDCIRNSKEAVAQNKFSHNELYKKKTDEQIAMVKEQFGIDWKTDFKNGEKYGRFVIPFVSEVYYDGEEEPTLRHSWKIYDGFPIGEENNRKEIMKVLEHE